MTFLYHPHAHVRIWLNNNTNEDSFINLENLIRLMNMRSLNPGDKIYLVYDSHLLSSSALTSLRLFCDDYRIIPKDVQVDIFPACTTREELNLISVYQKEIQNLGAGGNLAVASDLLRWLKPVYGLGGTYSDFDVHLDTQGLPEAIEVNSSILMNIGSTVSRILMFYRFEFIALNNDLIAIVDAEAAAPLIQKVQESIYMACLPYSEGSSPYNEFVSSDYQNLQAEVGGWVDYFSLIRAHPHLHQLSQGKSALAMRASILRDTANNSVFCSGVNQNVAQYASEQRQHYKQLLGFFNWLTTSSVDYQYFQTLSQADDEELVKRIRENLRFLFLKESVIYTTGPGRILSALFQKKCYSSQDEFNQAVSPYSFWHYGLEEAFFSKNTIPLHMDPKDYQVFLERSVVGKNSDVSWLQEGLQQTKAREQKILNALSQRQAPVFKTEMGFKEMSTALWLTFLRLSQQHTLQIILAKQQMQELLSNEKSHLVRNTLLLSNCANTSDAQIACLSTRVKFSIKQTTPEFSYACTPFQNSTLGLSCFLETDENIAYVRDKEASPFVFIAFYGFMTTALSEYIANASQVFLGVSENKKGYVHQVTTFLLLGLFYSWAGAFIALTSTVILKKIGCSYEVASVIGNTVPLIIDSAEVSPTTGLVKAAVMCTAGYFGFWTQKRVATHWESPYPGIHIQYGAGGGGLTRAPDFSTKVLKEPENAPESSNISMRP